MIHGGASPEEYLAALEDDWKKETLSTVRSLLLSHPELTEGINYKMLAYSSKPDVEPLFHLNAQKNYVSLYVGDIVKVDPKNELLAGLNCGKGCIRVSKSVKVSETGLPEFIRKTVEFDAAGGDTAC